MGYRKRKRSCGNQSDRKTWSSLEDVDDGMVVWVLMIRQSRVELNRKGVQGNGCTEWEQSSSSVAWCTEVAAVGCVLRGAWCTDQGMKSGKTWRKFGGIYVVQRNSRSSKRRHSGDGDEIGGPDACG
ncbi:hypothetical protein F0562_010450 [Nyssa sinensis]|uniref:Uncharacterized protein n=1 Tax=Nyssa sinensis TaxID=561372 RepID=A0A5J5A1G9_9ASTE|nr:hypothetical protein F0562_010450 [Nyssa sinensis]